MAVEAFCTAAVVVADSSGVVAVVAAAADQTSHTKARFAKPSQASQSREGLSRTLGYVRDVIFVQVT